MENEPKTKGGYYWEQPDFTEEDNLSSLNPTTMLNPEKPHVPSGKVVYSQPDTGTTSQPGGKEPDVDGLGW